MDLSFLILVAAPLSVYLVLILYSVKDIESSDAPVAQADAPTTDTSSAHDVPIVTELAPDVSAADSIGRDTSVAIIAARESETLEPARAETIQDASATETPLVPNAPAQSDIASENQDSYIAELGSAITLTDNATAPENDVPPPLAAKAPADTPIITEPDADSSSENSDNAETAETDALPDGPLQFPEKGSPKFVFDYRGRLWVEKKNRGFFKQLRRPQLPPDEPQ